MKVEKYFAPLRVVVDIGPQMSECINSNTPLVLLLLLGNDALVHFPSTHPLQTLSFFVLSSGAPMTVF